MVINDFKIGVEIEGFYKDKVKFDSFISDLKETTPIDFKIIKDGSLQSNKNGTSFEIPLGPFVYGDEKFMNVLKILNNSEKYSLYFNDTCGLHTHFSSDRFDEKSKMWILSCVALDKNMFEMLTFDYNKSKNYYKYSSDSDIIEIKDAIANNEYGRLRLLLHKRKKRVLLRIHPQGTIEWRGPRYNEDHIDLYDYTGRIDYFVSWMDYILDKKIYEDWSFETLYNNIGWDYIPSKYRNKLNSDTNNRRFFAVLGRY